MSPTPDDRILTSPTEPEWNPLSAEREAFRAFVGLTRQKRDLKRLLEEIDGKLKTLELQLREYMGEGGYERIRIDGFTVYLRRELWARRFEWASLEKVCAALKSSGMEQFVKEQYNTSTLSAHIRELEREHAEELKTGALASVADLLAPELRAVLNVEPTYTVIAMERG